MPNVIQHKRNSTPGSIPGTGSLAQGELGLNLADGRLYTKNSSNVIINLPVTSISGTSITPASGNFSSSLQVNSVNVSLTGHTHTSSDITNFNSSVSGLLPTVANSGNNRVLTSTGTTVGVSGQTNLVFTGSNLGVNTSSPSGAIHVVGSGLVSSVTGTVPNSLFHIYSATSGANIFNVEGTNGSLFSVVDSLSGSLMSVNNNAGLPVFEVFSDDRVVAGRYNQNDLVVTSGGNVGIGVAAPTNKLQVLGNSLISGVLSATSGNFNTLQVGGTGVSISGHTHTSSDITNFNSSVSGLVSGVYAPLSGKLNQFASTSSSELFGVISDETGSGLLVFNNSPTLTGVPLTPTAASGTNTNQIASTAFVRTEISNLVASAPATLDTLNELAAALGNDANFSTTVTNNLAGKANLSGASFTGNVSAPTGNFTVLQQNGVGVSTVGHSHTSSNITDFNSAVSGLLPVKNINGSGYINVSNSSGNYTISVSGLQPSGNYANSVHSHGNITSSGTIIGGDDAMYNHIVLGINGEVFANPCVYNSQRLFDSANGQWVLELVDTAVRWSGWSGYPNAFRESISAAYSGHIHGNITNGGSIGSTSGLLVTTGSDGILTTSSGINSNLINNFNSSVSGLVSGVYVPITRTITPGSGLAGSTALDLSSNRTLDIGQGDGILVSADSIAVNNTVVRTTGNQYVSGEKRFRTILYAVSGIEINGDPSLTTRYGDQLNIFYEDENTEYLAQFITNSNKNLNSIKLNAVTEFNNVASTGVLPFIISPTGYAGSGAITQGYWRGTAIETDKGGTGRTSYSNGQLLIGSGTSLAANTLSAGTGITITNGSGSITIAITGLINNPTNNRILTSRDNTSTGIDAESNLTFDGSGLVVTGNARVGNLILDTNTLSSTSGNIIISPSGNGALQRDAGGNARGQYSVDWQGVRSSGTMVAGGNYSTVGGGRSNTSSGYASTVGGGRSNTSSGDNSTVGGGVSNTSSAYYSTVCGGKSNNSSSDYSVVVGGWLNSVAGLGKNFVGGGAYNHTNSSYNTVGGGFNNIINTGGASTIAGGDNNTINGYLCFIGGGGSNTSSGYYSSTVSGGKSNTASGNYSTVGGGKSNTSSGGSSTVGGGRSNTSSAYYSTVGGGYINTSSGYASTVPGGFRGKATRYGELSHSAGIFAQVGDAQHSILIARRETTDSTANVVLTLDGNSPSSLNRLTLPSQTSWSFSIKISAYNSTDNQGAWWIIRGGIRRNNSNGTVLVGSLISENGAESSLSAAVATVVADDTNEALEIRVTGITGKTIRWVAVVDLSQVSFGTP